MEGDQVCDHVFYVKGWTRLARRGSISPQGPISPQRHLPAAWRLSVHVIAALAFAPPPSRG